MLEALSDLFESGEVGLDPVVVVGLGELGWSLTDEQDQRAVGSDVVDPAVVGSSCPPTVAVLEPVVRSAFGSGVGLIGATTVGVRLVVVDLAAFGGDFAAGVVAESFQQCGCDAGVAGEQPFAFTQVDDGRAGVEYDASDVGGEQCLDTRRGGSG